MNYNKSLFFFAVTQTTEDLFVKLYFMILISNYSVKTPINLIRNLSYSMQSTLTQ